MVALSDLPAEVRRAVTLDRALPSDSTGKGAPEWVHLLPSGLITGRDGRSYDLADPGGLILAFQANAIDLAIDSEHQSEKPEARLKGPVPAAGWIKDLQIRDGGIWGRVEWTATAAQMIAAKEYRFLSPAILCHPETRKIMRLKGAGLDHNPNLFLTALAAQEAPMPDNSSPQSFATLVAQLLGLPYGTPPEELLAKLGAALKALPDPARFMPVAAVQEMLRTRRTETALHAQQRVKSKVDAALREHYITNGMRDWATSLCETDEAAFDTFCDSNGPMFACLFKPAGGVARVPNRPAPLGNDLESSICEQLGLKPGALHT